MQDFITVQCSRCKQQFKIDREAHASFGLDVCSKPFSFGFTGSILEDEFEIIVHPKDDICKQCCILIVEQAVQMWADAEDLYLQQDSISEEFKLYDRYQKEVSSLRKDMLADFKEQRQGFLAITALLLFLGTVLLIISMFV